MKWVTRGDIDGFFGLAVDNLVQLLLIDALGRHVLGFSPSLLYGRVLPGVALSLAVGNVYYALAARRLSRAERRADVCALPYGINTVSLFAYVFLVMLPVKIAATSRGDPHPEITAWQTGLWACFGSGLIEFFGSFVAEKVRRATPRAALLSTLSGVALGFISLGFLFRAYARPIVGLSTLAIVLVVYFGRVRLRGGIPGGLVAVLLGIFLCWVQGYAPVGDLPRQGLSLTVPIPVFGDLWAGISAVDAFTHVAVILPMGLFNLIGSLQNLESAEASGDSYQTAPSLAVNGVGTMVAALFGSCFPTTIYIGHPGWKAMGARAGYSLLNAAFFLVVLLSGALTYVTWAMPVDAGLAIVLWIGIVITAQSFETTPRSHAPAVVLGLLPGVAAWGTLIAKHGLRAAGVGTPSGPSFGPDLVERFAESDTWIAGGFALEQGFLFTSMILAAATTCVIERKFRKAGVWCLLGAISSSVGLMHSYRYTSSDTALSLSPAWPWAAGYLCMACVFALAPWVSRKPEEESTFGASSDEPTNGSRPPQ